MKKYDLAFIGSCGIPNTYGGFEAFLEAVCPSLVENGLSVVVTCDPSRHTNFSPVYNGVERVFINIKANGWKSTFHDLVAFLSVFRQSKTVYVLGVSAGPFFLIFRSLGFLFGTRLVVNVDGVEWRRGKFNPSVKLVLWFYDLMAQLSADVIIYDNLALVDYVKRRYRSKSSLLAYTGDHVVRLTDVDIKPKSALTICRIEPENNVEELILGAMNSQLEIYTIIGNWSNSDYGQQLKQKYSNQPQINLVDPIYDKHKVAEYRESTFLYLHGHSVGGSNPSLIEMLSYRCHIVCKDCSFNRETAGSDASYYNTIEDLTLLIDALINQPITQRNLQERYTTSKIVEEIIRVS